VAWSAIKIPSASSSTFSSCAAESWPSSKINMREDYEVKYWTHALGVSREQLQKTVDKVGNSAAAVCKELGVDEPVQT
jgi:uncharacterized protein DUF3606